MLDGSRNAPIVRVERTPEEILAGQREGMVAAVQQELVRTGLGREEAVAFCGAAMPLYYPQVQSNFAGLALRPIFESADMAQRLVDTWVEKGLLEKSSSGSTHFLAQLTNSGRRLFEAVNALQQFESYMAL
jgi:hypothetical protein